MAAKQADAGQRRAASEPATAPAPRAHLYGIFTLNRLPFWLLLIVILLGAGLTALILNLIFPWDSSIADLPFAIQSPLRANYSADPRAAAIAQVDLKLLSQVLADEPDMSSAFRVETIVQGLNTLVATVTPLFTQAFPSTPTPTISLTTATAPDRQTFTLAPSATLTVTASPTQTRLPTQPLTTRVPPTAAPSATPRPADTSAPPPTEPPPPTQPPPPTATEPPPPDTATPPPPTQPWYPPPPTAYPAPDD